MLENFGPDCMGDRPIYSSMWEAQHYPMTLINPACYGSELLNKRISKFEGPYKPGPVLASGKRIKVKNCIKKGKVKDASSAAKAGK